MNQCTKPVETNPGLFDDSTDHAQTFWGVYAVRPLSVLPLKGSLDLYYLGLDKKRARFDQGAGRERRHTIGTRLWDDRGTLDYNIELIYQFGAFQGRQKGDISAWTVASDVGYVFREAFLQPRIGFFDGIRRLSHDLHPTTLRVLGFIPALKAHCEEVEKRHDVQVTFIAEGDFGDVHPDVAVSFFRIAQESLRNAIEHGEAKLCTVKATRLGRDLELTVADDGRGFDLTSARREGRGLGLVTMEERAGAIGATIQIAAESGHGTTVYVRGPVQPAESKPEGRRSLAT